MEAFYSALLNATLTITSTAALNVWREIKTLTFQYEKQETNKQRKKSTCEHGGDKHRQALLDTSSGRTINTNHYC